MIVSHPAGLSAYRILGDVLYMTDTVQVRTATCIPFESVVVKQDLHGALLAVTVTFRSELQHP